MKSLLKKRHQRQLPALGGLTHHWVGSAQLKFQCSHHQVHPDHHQEHLHHRQRHRINKQLRKMTRHHKSHLKKYQILQRRAVSPTRLQRQEPHGRLRGRVRGDKYESRWG